MKATDSQEARRRGRPRSFDRDTALEAAMVLFWRQGYASTSIADLTAAMGISPPSLYAAFVDKEHLFLEAVERYQCGVGASAGTILAAAPDARGAIAALLEAAAARLTSPDRPSGCMIVTAAMNCPEEGAHLQAALAARRARSQATIVARIEQGMRAGELPAEADAAGLAAFYDTVLQGMTIQARDGATHAQLLATVIAAMRAWPDGGGGPGEGVPPGSPG